VRQFRTLGSVRGEAAGRPTDGRADLPYSEAWSVGAAELAVIPG